MSKKFIAAAVVALFCVTAFACTAGESDAASKDLREIYFEDVAISDDGVLTVTKNYIYFESDGKSDDYVKAATLACQQLGLDVTVSNTAGYIWFVHDGATATYFAKDGKWAAVTGDTDYLDNKTVGVALSNGYISAETYGKLSQTGKIQYAESGMTGDYAYVKILDSEVANAEHKKYMAYLTIIEDNLTDFESTVVTFTCDKNPYAWCDAFNLATANLGDSVFSDVKVKVKSETSISVDYRGSTATWVKEDGKWAKTTQTAVQYVAASEVDFELVNGWISQEQYDTLSDAQKKLWVGDSMMPGWYMREATGEIVEKALEIALIIGVVIVIIVIAVIVFFVLRSRKKQAA